MMPNVPSEAHSSEDKVDTSVTTVLDSPLQTGGVDKETQPLLREPRLPRDGHNLRKRQNRRKRYVITHKKWNMTNLTYTIYVYPRDPSKAAVDEVFGQAFYMWSNVTNLEFQHVNDDTAHIKISFLYGNHDDSIPFTETSYSHASPPTSGVIHFDRSIPWTVRDTTGIDLLQVAVYEIGHALGLKDSEEEDSVMKPYVKPIFNPNFALFEDDIKGIQALYGEKQRRPTDLCSKSSFDAIFEYCDGLIYVFKGEYFWKLAPDGIVSSNPQLISHKWHDVPSDLDAATATDSGLIFFFKGNRYWKYRDSTPVRFNYSISEGWRGVPGDIDAATWDGNSKYYFFKGNQYWEYNVYDRRYHANGPKNLTDWGSIEEHNIQAVLYVQSGYIYFFTNGIYYRYNIKTKMIDDEQPKYPRPVGRWWFRCEAPPINYNTTSTVIELTTEQTTIEETTTEETTVEITTEETTTEETTTEDSTTEETTTEETTTEETTTEETTTEETTTEETTTEETTTEETKTEETKTEETTTEETTTEETTTEETTTEETTTEETTEETTTEETTTEETTTEETTTEETTTEETTTEETTTEETTTEETTTEETTTEETTTEETTTEETTTEETTTEETTTEETTTEETTTEETTTEETTTEETTTEETTTEETTTEETTTEETTTEETTTEETTEETTTDETTTEETTTEETTTKTTTIETSDEILTDPEETENTITVEPAGRESYDDEEIAVLYSDGAGRKLVNAQDDLYISGEVQEMAVEEWKNAGTGILPSSFVCGLSFFIFFYKILISQLNVEV